MTANHEHSAEPTALQNLARWAQVFIASLLLIFSLGLLTGIITAIAEDAVVTAKDVGLVAGAVALIAGSMFWLWKLRPFTDNGEPISERTKRTRRYLALSMAIGVALGIGFSMSGMSEGDSSSVFSNSPLPTMPAIVLSVIYLLLVPIVGWLWHRSIDEHEAAANSVGALAGIYAYSMITPVWWVGERADLLPPQQPMVVFLIVMAVWGAVWAFKRT
ncbi:hypothetical protein [Qipengyuania sphaerica]|uniref:hypothetical protein n=1 Tax=Qipengyuania sphaerica TaxID=2867243 RepID=UPI001C86F5D5|nr:hypothetical protein [Qipengyuania sphaerica]MBX7540744.1 hypothetical protein [Qipengyuania sphaerica]